MRVMILAVGRLKAGPEVELADRYRKRFDGSGRTLGLGPIAVTELPESRDGNVDVRRADEAGRLLAKVGSSASAIALDEGGRNLTSAAFAELIGERRDDGTSEIVFLIGGPDGHGGEIARQATDRLSFGAMTLPHGLVRVVLLEQLYRAATILAGHPYHRA